MNVWVSAHSDCACLLTLPRRHMAQVVSDMVAVSPCPWLQVDVLVVRDGQMAALNARHMGCSGPTNVLSFPSSDQPQQEQSAGRAIATLVLAVDTVRREAFLYGQESAEYTVWLLAHGMGHLMGYDHGPEMSRLCAELFSVGMETLAGAKQHSAWPGAFVPRPAPCCATPVQGG